MATSKQLNIMKRATLVLMVIFVMITGGVFAQNPENSAEVYRVVAVSLSDNTIKSESNAVEMYFPMNLYLPTAFTPNGDGLNDSFGAVGEGIEDYKLVVYNRWGEVIFSSYAVSKKWDGNHKGKPVAFGSYNYELLAAGKEFGKIHRSGIVTVVK